MDVSLTTTNQTRSNAYSLLLYPDTYLATLAPFKPMSVLTPHYILNHSTALELKSTNIQFEASGDMATHGTHPPEEAT